MGLDSPGPVSLLLTTQRRLGYSRDVSKFDAEAQQVAASEGHAQAPYLAAKARFKSSTFQTNLQNKPTCPLHLMSLQGFYCFLSVFLRHCSVRGFDCLVFCLLRHHAFSLRFLLVHYLFVTSVLCSRLRLSFLLFVTSLCFLLIVSLFHYLFVTSVGLLCSRLRLSLPL